MLILGETGTGKELFARAIHRFSPRAEGPLVALNCAAIPTELVESELFGHERGAFTGAHAARKGVIAQAQGGSLFLDEVGCLPAFAQAKLLRFLQEKEFRTVGGEKVQRADVRVIAATNEDLGACVATGRFRQDLYYRLNVVQLRLPPLRERRADILPLTRYFLASTATRLGVSLKNLSVHAASVLQQHDWPGNVRELEHAIERALVMTNGDELTAEDLGLETPPPVEAASTPKSLRERKAQVVAEFERQDIEGLLTVHHGNISRAAKEAGKNRRAFWELIRKHGIDADFFRTAS